MRDHCRALPLIAVALLAAGCGGGSDKPAAKAPAKPAKASTASQGTVALQADPSGALQFTETKLTARAGKVTLRLANPSQVPHSIAVEGQGVDADSPQAQVGKGQTASVTATLKPGRYKFYCPVANHEAAGMTGTLTVK